MSSRTEWQSTFTFTYGPRRPYTIPLAHDHAREVENYLAQSQSAASEPEHLASFIGSTHCGRAVHWFLGFPAFDKRTGERCGQHVFDVIQAPKPNDDHWIIRERGRGGASAGPRSPGTYTDQCIRPVLLLDRATRQRCIWQLFLKYTIQIGSHQSWEHIGCISYVWDTLLRMTEVPEVVKMARHPDTGLPFPSSAALRHHVEGCLHELHRFG